MGGAKIFKAKRRDLSKVKKSLLPLLKLLWGLCFLDGFGYKLVRKISTGRYIKKKIAVD